MIVVVVLCYYCKYVCDRMSFQEMEIKNNPTKCNLTSGTGSGSYTA